MRKQQKMSIALASLVTLASTLAVYGDEYTSAVPLHGCYKNNGIDSCVESTRINCTDNLTANVELYGPVIASVCDDINHYSKVTLGAISQAKYSDRIVKRQYKTIRKLGKLLGYSKARIDALTID